MIGGHKDHRFTAWLVHVPLLVLSATMLVPLAFMFVTALATPEQALAPTDSWRDLIVPRTWRWMNFVEVWRLVPFLRYYMNSLVVALLVTAGQVATSACAAFAFSRLRWPGRDRLFLAYLATMMIPQSVTMIPNFILMKLLPDWLAQTIPVIDWTSWRYLGPHDGATFVGRLVGLDSYFALIVPGMFSAYGTFLLRQFMLSIPRELDEAAKIDGCNYWQIFSRVITPLSLPGVATLTIFTFMGVWSSYLWPLVTTNQDVLRTLPVGLQAFQGQYGSDWHLLMAAALLMLLPVIAIFIIGQKFFIRGLVIGAVKG